MRHFACLLLAGHAKRALVALFHAPGCEDASIINVLVQLVVEILANGGVLKGQLQLVQLDTTVLDGANEEILERE